MQILDVNSFLVRVGLFYFRKKGVALEFMTIPMIHIGEAEFYRNAQQKMIDKCDVILYEGIEIADRYAKGYDRIATNLGLVQQNFQREAFEKKEMIHADLTQEEAKAAWQNVHWMSRKFFSISFALFARCYSAFMSRKQFAKGLRGRPSFSTFWWEKKKKEKSLDHFMLTLRDERLAEHISNIYTERKNYPIRVGILYGAGHTYKTVRYLIDTLKFQVYDAEFLTAFRI